MAHPAKAPKHLPTPVYVSLTSLVSAIAFLRDHGTPFPVDDTALLEISQSMRRQVLAGLRFLQLIDARGRSQPSLKALMDAYETRIWSEEFGRVIENAYEPLFQHQLHSITPAAFERIFRSIYPSTDNVTRKAITFFISAARSAELPLNAELFEGRRVRRSKEVDLEEVPPKSGVPAAGMVPQHPSRATGESHDAESPDKSVALNHRRAALVFLTDLLDETRMTDVEMSAVWTLVKYVRRCGDQH